MNPGFYRYGEEEAITNLLRFQKNAPHILTSKTLVMSRQVFFAKVAIKDAPLAYYRFYR